MSWRAPEAGHGSEESRDEARRVRLGASTATSGDILLALATDQRVTVRAAVAMNPAAPHEVEQALAFDPDERVRILLARKIAGGLPGLSGDEQARVRQHVLEMLSVLVEDEAVRVRAALSDVLKDMPQAPRDVILRLARDSAVPVSEPVIRLSPLLDVADLLALLAAPPHEAAEAAVARRANLPAEVSDGVAATANTEAVRLLLNNASAQIRESTLDALVARATLHTEWQEPLVRRPQLPNPAARALSTFVADRLVELLAARADLDPGLAIELRRRVTIRLAAPSGADRDEIVPLRAFHPAPSGHDEAAAVAAARRGDERRAASLLASAAGVPVELVERAGALRSAKGIVSLVWKAGFSMQSAGPLQTVLGQIGPAAILLPAATGEFPLSPEEMQWHCEFLAQPGRYRERVA